MENLLTSNITEAKKILSDLINSGLVGEVSEEYLNILKQQYDRRNVTFKNIKSTDIDAIYIFKSRNYNNNNIQLEVKGTLYEISIPHLAGSKPKSERTEFSKICRKEILNQIYEFKNNNPLNPKGICEVTGDPLGYDAEVDHQIPFTFQKLLNDWVNLEHGGEYKGLCTFDLDQGRFALVNAESWRQYHKEHATLRWLSEKGNRIAHRL